jgi:hypothetical protein
MDLDSTLAADMDWQGAAQAHGLPHRTESDSLGPVAVPAHRLWARKLSALARIFPSASTDFVGGGR